MAWPIQISRIHSHNRLKETLIWALGNGGSAIDVFMAASCAMNGRRRRALTSGCVVGQAQRGDAVGARDVEDVEALRVRHAAVGAAVGEAVQDLARDGAGVAARRAVLRQHHAAARHHRVRNPTHNH